MKKLNIVLRTCEGNSLQSNRIYPKDITALTCLYSLLKSLENYKHDYHLHIIDDNSSGSFRTKIQKLISFNNKISIEYINKVETDLTSKQKSRYSLKVALDYISELSDEELIYLVEDDYLHYPDSISNMINSYNYFDYIMFQHIGIFPQDFNQLTFRPENPFNNVYNRLTEVLPGTDRYYITTWFTQESFLISKHLFNEFKDDFYSLLKIGFEDGAWEGNTISNIWNNKSVKMLMPLDSLVIHLGSLNDISNFKNDWVELFNINNDIINRL